MDFRLFIVTLERFGDVSYKRFIDLFFEYYYSGLRPHYLGAVISVDHIHMTTAVFILIGIPIPRIYRGIRGISAVLPSIPSPCRSLAAISATSIITYHHRRILMQQPFSSRRIWSMHWTDLLQSEQQQGRSVDLTTVGLHRKSSRPGKSASLGETIRKNEIGNRQEGASSIQP